MKRSLLLFIPMLLVLTACGKPADPASSFSPTSVPESVSIPAPSASEAPEAGWWEHLEPSLLPDETGVCSDINGVSCWLMGTAGDAALYCGLDSQSGGWLLRRGETVKYFSSPMTSLPEVMPRLQWGDFDGDGTEELLILYYVTPHAADLHIYEWEDTAGWSDRHFGPDQYNPVLRDALVYRYDSISKTLFCSCGDETVSYRLGPEETRNAIPLDSYSGLLFYRVQDAGVINAVFGVGAYLGEQTCYFANLTAGLLYNGEGFSLSNLSLTATGGV